MAITGFETTLLETKVLELFVDVDIEVVVDTAQLQSTIVVNIKVVKGSQIDILIITYFTIINYYRENRS
jgi:hypothetical protein